jgi:tetratricopeptide (TPR) repeat protein
MNLENAFRYLLQDPNNPKLLIDIAHGFRLQNKLTDALEYIQKAYAIDKVSSSPEYGIILIKLNQFESAINILENITHKNDTINYYLSYSYYRSGKFASALASLSNVNPKNLTLEAELLTAKIYHHLGQLDECINLLEKTIIKHPANISLLEALCLAKFDINHTKDAKSLAEKLLTIDTNNYHGKLISTLLHAENGQISIKHLSELIAIEPNDSRTWFLLGAYHLNNKQNIKKARLAFLEAHRIHPEFFDNLLSLAICDLLELNLPSALKYTEHALSMAPTDNNANACLAIIRHLQKKPRLEKKAIDAISEPTVLGHIALALFYFEKDEEKYQCHFNKIITPDDKNKQSTNSILLKSLISACV